MKIARRQLRRIIREEKARLLRELTPGDAGIAAAGGGTPAHQGFAAAAAEAETEWKTQGLPLVPGALEDQMMEMLEEYITQLAESGEEGAVEVETLLTQLVSRAIDIATRDGIIR